MAVSCTPAPEDSPPAALTPDWAAAGLHLQMAGPAADRALWSRVIRHARCADGTHDPEQWFPLSAEIEKARQEAAAAITVCTSCPVRAQCLALSFRHWDIGQHGVWGGLVAAERAELRQIVLAHVARHAPHLLLIAGDTAGQVAGAGHLALVTTASGPGAGLAGATRTAPAS